MNWTSRCIRSSNIVEPIIFWQGSKSDNYLLLFLPSTSCNFYIANTIFYQVLLASFIVVNSRVHISFIMIKSVNCLITCSYLLTIVCDSCMWTSWSFGLWLAPMLYLTWNLPKEKKNLYQKICSPPQLVERFGETQLLNPKNLSFTRRCHNKKKIVRKLWF